MKTIAAILVRAMTLRLVLPREKKEKGDKKLENENENHNAAPAVTASMQIPSDLMRQIARPDDEKLCERHVGPHHGKREQETPQMMKIFPARDLGQRRARREPGQQHDHENERAQHLPDADQDREHGRIPIGFERHDPVDVSERCW